LIATASTEPELVTRLTRFIWFDVSACATAVLMLVVVRAALVDSGYVVVLAVLVALGGAVMGLGLVRTRRGDLVSAVWCVAAANWVIALGATAIAPFAMPLMIITSLFPAVLAAPYLRLRQLGWVIVIGLGVSVAVSVVGTLQDFSGLTALLPDWVPDMVVIGFVPFVAGMISVIAWQNSRRVHDALEASLAANESLRASERELRASRTRLVTGIDGERRRFERDLHDGAQQRLIAVVVQLRVAQDLCRTAPEDAALLLGRLRDEVHHAIDELRDLAHGIYPSVLHDRGLGPALDAAALRCPIPCEVEVADGRRHHTGIETAVYFCCLEALQNAAKHGRPDTRVRIEVADENGLRFTVTDDGPGFDVAHTEPGRGLQNMADRLGAFGGTVFIDSAVGEGTRVRGHVPRQAAFEG
jgi:signal transduction histidine kinase